jgi:hypothetical protein
MAEDIDNTQQTSETSSPASGNADGPVGSGSYEVQQGDCIESVAYSHGHFWKTIWNHPDNQRLKSQRKDPNVLLPGDRVFVPDLQLKQEPGASEQRHRFRRKGVPSKLSIVLKDEEGQPRAGLDYVLEIDGELLRGKTDGAGRLRHPIPPNAQRGKITVTTRDRKEEYLLQLGHLDPVTKISGVQARLSNLGFPCGPANGTLSEATRRALAEFQAKHQLKQSGEPDQATRDRLKQEHGS